MVTAAALAAVYWIFLLPRPRQADSDSAAHETSSSARLQQARRYFGDGMFRLAADELQTEPTELPPDQKRLWRQLKREASLYADLCTEPLEDILRHAATTPEPEWQADFPRRFAGKTIIFDTIVQRTASGKLRATYVFAGPERTNLEINALDLLRQLPLDQPRRVLFGARLAGIRLEAPGPSWVVRFEPDSGVLLTDATAAGLCCAALNEPDAIRILADQAKFLPR
jgi:hypothetical protein